MSYKYPIYLFLSTESKVGMYVCICIRMHIYACVNMLICMVRAKWILVNTY